MKGQSRYPLADWFDGRVWRIEEHDHDLPDFPRFRSAIVNPAKRRGFRLHVRKETTRTGLIWVTPL